MIGRVLIGVAAAFFFLGAVESVLIPRPTAWGLFFLALGLLFTGMPIPWVVRKAE